MSKTIENLKDWFDKLTPAKQTEVLKFLYGGLIIEEGEYLGPRREFITEGLFCGPAPKLKANVCPTCKRPI